MTNFTLVALWYEGNVSRENEAIRIAPKHNNSLETSPYEIRKHYAMYQFDITLQIPS